jgi:hypothetical protein
LLVMGCDDRSRACEVLLGGATRTVLHDAAGADGALKAVAPARRTDRCGGAVEHRQPAPRTRA